MRKLFFGGNWKMNIPEMYDYQLEKVENEVVIFPPFTMLPLLKGLKRNFSIGAQNCHYEETGAFTGEVSPSMIKEHADYVIIGHSERREYFGENNETVNKKIATALKFLKVVFCVGETLADREKDKTKNIIKAQITEGLAGIDIDNDFIVAYEPVWAIGTGKTASPEQAEEVHSFIRKLIEDLYSKDIAQSIRIIYGGSMKPDNVKDLVSKENIDGGLVGGASLDSESFNKIIKVQ